MSIAVLDMLTCFTISISNIHCNGQDDCEGKEAQNTYWRHLQTNRQPQKITALALGVKRVNSQQTTDTRCPHSETGSHTQRVCETRLTNKKIGSLLVHMLESHNSQSHLTVNHNKLPQDLMKWTLEVCKQMNKTNEKTYGLLYQIERHKV